MSDVGKDDVREGEERGRKGREMREGRCKGKRGEGRKEGRDGK